jgi:hypothetical protein
MWVGAAAICSHKKIGFSGINTPDSTAMAAMYQPVSILCWRLGINAWVRRLQKDEL